MKFFNFSKGERNLVTAPHASQERYDDERRGSADRGSDIIAKKIHKELNFNLILPYFSRFIIDFNRKKKESILSKFKTYNLTKINVDEREKRLKQYDEYYKLIKKVSSKGGLHVSIHTMTPVGAIKSVDEGIIRPDFRLGTFNNLSMNEIELKPIVKYFEDNNYSVEINNYFCGGEEILFSSKNGMRSLQIEINSKHILDFEKDKIDLEKLEKIAEVVLMGVKEILKNNLKIKKRLSKI